MIEVQDFHRILRHNGVDFFTGVPDSQLQAFCDYILSLYGTGASHIIAANEGNAVAVAAGYHLATGKTALVYMQNSGLGNAVNPITSLIDPQVYGIPTVFLVGWRGRPGAHDEPQHVKQGAITLELLELLGVECFVLTHDTGPREIEEAFAGRFGPALRKGRSVALVVQKGAFAPYLAGRSQSTLTMSRERAIQLIASLLDGNDIVISTTGKASRELYEYRANSGLSVGRDFLTVGSMGHASMIALGVAEQKRDKRIWCFDGDGALLMHMGGMALIGSRRPRNYFHVVLNNGAHESVGGMPTVASNIDMLAIAKACGYAMAARVATPEELVMQMSELNRQQGPCFLQVDVNLESRADLGRPGSTPVANKMEFMRYLMSSPDEQESC